VWMCRTICLVTILPSYLLLIQSRATKDPPFRPICVPEMHFRRGPLVELQFGILGRTTLSSVEIVDAMLSDPQGGIAALASARLTDVRVLPSEFGLNQNFPNLFNPETQIAFQIPQAGELSLVVYNTLGQTVRALAQGVLDARFHRVVWDGKDSLGRSVSSGVYLIRMRAASFKSIKKMLLLK
jgi:hypothetical protein